MDEMKIALPGISAANKPLANAWEAKKVPSRLTDITLRHSEAATSTLSFHIVIPAAVTRICGVQSVLSLRQTLWLANQGQ